MPGSRCGAAAVRQLVFIDHHTPDPDCLLCGLEPGRRAHLLDPARDALGQIADVLAQHGAVQAVHIVAHGSPGALHFASGTFARGNLASHAAALARIGAALTPGGELLLWACETGRGQAGEQFLNALAAVTGANVAAATHAVGSRAHGGIFELDAAVGAVTAGVPFTPAAQSHFAGMLANTPPVLTLNVGVTPTYTENGAGAVLASGLTVTGAIPSLFSATVRITGGLRTGDLLTANVAGTGISPSYNATTGTLTLTGLDSLTNYQAVLRTVAFSSTSDNPTDFGADTARSFEWQVSDAPSSTNTVTPGGNPHAPAIADFNGDNKLDLAVPTGSGLAELLGNGDGTFGSATNILSGSNFVAAGDLNGDGKQDLVAIPSGLSNSNVSILLGNGNGTFAPVANVAAGQVPQFVAIGDFNGDGKADLAVANFSSVDVSVLLGNGDGTFTPATPAATGASPLTLAIGDFNGDGKLDLAAGLNNDTVSILLGDGHGAFGPAINIAVGGSPSSLAVGDLNGDGKLDFAVTANASSTAAVGNVAVFFGNGDGTFNFGSNVRTDLPANSVSIADLDGDGKLDLAVAIDQFTSASNRVSVFTNRGDGTFGAPTNFVTGPGFGEVVIADLNQNGALDLVVANSGAVALTFPITIGPGNISVLLDAGNISQFQHSSVTVAAVDDAPVLGGANNVVLYRKQAAAVTVDPFLTISDVDSATLDSARVTISSGRQTGDTLHFTSQNGISGAYNGTTGVLTLTGTATLAQYQAALRTVTFDNLSNPNPTNSHTSSTRTITWVANDGTLDSSGVTTTIGVLDPPVLGNAPPASYTAHAAPTVLAGGLTISGNTVANLVSATVHISGVRFGDVLAANVAGTSISQSYDAATGTLVLTGLDTLGHYQQVLQTVTFSSSSDNPTDFGLYASRTIDWQVNDGTNPGLLLQTHVDYTLSNPNHVAIADLNGDGKNDLVAAGGGTVSVLLGNGDGTFGAVSTWGAGDAPVLVAIGDFNRDGNRDLAVANAISGTVSVLLGNGDGTFQTASNYATGSEPRSVATADINGDGTLDLVVANTFANTVSVLLGAGDGTFQPATNINVGNHPASVAIEDFNGDGKLDLVTANAQDFEVAVLLGNGDGTFGAVANFATGEFPVSVAVGDFNADGKLDLATANLGSGFGPGDVSVLLGNGDGTFNAAATYTADVNPVSVAIGDLNGDGKVDLAVANGGSGVSVLFGSGDGTFNTAGNFAGPVRALQAVAIGDLDGAGGLDLVFATPQVALTTQSIYPGSVSTLLNAGSSIGTLHSLVAVTGLPLLFGGGNTVAYTEQAAPLVIDAALTVSNAGSPTLPGATVRIANGFVAGDVLTFTNDGSTMGNISGSYDGAGTLTLTSQNATATVAQWQAALRAVTFSTPSDNPTDFGTDLSRTIAWQLDDGSNSQQTTTIQIVAVNDTPVLSNVGPSASAIEQAPVVLDIDASVSDVDLDTGAGNYAGAALFVTRSGGANPDDSFGFDTAGGTFTVNGANLQAGGLTFATFANLGGSLFVTFNSAQTAATTALVNNVLDHITYTNLSDAPPPTVTLSYKFDDGSPGNGQFNGDIGFVFGSTQVNIAPVNDAPTLTAAGLTSTFTEGGTSVDLFNAVTASTVEAGQTFTSLTLTVTNVADGASEILNFNGNDLALTNGNAVAGATVSLAGTTATVTFGGALTAAELQTLLDGLRYRNTSDAPTDADRVVTITQVVDSGPGGGPDANAAALNIVASVNVDPVNDAPAVTAPALYAGTFNVAVRIDGITFSDVDGSSGSEVATFHAASGTLAAMSAGGVTVGGSGTATLTLAGTIADLNAFIAGGNLAFTGVQNTLVNVTLNDQGHNGAGGAQVGTDNFAIDLSHALPLLPQGDGHFDPAHSTGRMLRHDDGTFRIDTIDANQLTSHLVGAVGNEWRFLDLGDFNHDGNSDMVSQRSADHMLFIHSIANDRVIDAGFLGAIGGEWSFRGAGDFNHDGTSDLLWQHDGDGALLVHTIQNNKVVGAASPGAIGTDWNFLGVGDFNHDGTSDLLWQRDGDGMLLIHDINNNRVSGAALLGRIGSDWHFAGIGDFNGDHTDDFLFQNNDGTLRVYNMNNSQVASSQEVGILAPDTFIAGIGEYTGDGRDDLILRHDNGTIELRALPFGPGGQGIVAGQTPTEWHVL